MSESSVDTGNTVALFQGYLSLPSDDSGSEGDIEGAAHPAMDGLEEMRQQFQQLQAQLAATNRELIELRIFITKRHKMISIFFEHLSISF